jgi:NADPH:quinone reductase
MLSILGYSTFDVPQPDIAAAYRALVEHAAAGRLCVDYDSYPLEQVAQAWRRQHDGAHRKLILIP